MKRQLLCVTLVCFALGAMDNQGAEQGEVPSLSLLSAQATAALLQRSDMQEKIFSDVTLPSQVNAKVGSLMVCEHPVRQTILSFAPIKLKDGRDFSPQITGSPIGQNNVSPNGLLTIKRGTELTNLTLEDHHGNQYRLENSKGYNVYHTCFSPDSKKIAVLTGCDASFLSCVCIWDIATKQLMVERPCFLYGSHNNTSVLNWSNDGLQLQVGDGHTEYFFDLRELLKIEDYFSGQKLDEAQENKYLKQIALLIWLHDLKASRWFTQWRSIDISQDELKKNIFSTLPPRIQSILVDPRKYGVNLQKTTKFDQLIKLFGA